jgi:hypothetical protein
LAIDRAGVLHADVHPRQKRLEHPRRREVIGGADLAEVARRRLRALRAGDAEAGDVALRVVEIVIADPGQRQVGERLVAVGQPVECDGVARGANRPLAA